MKPSRLLACLALIVSSGLQNQAAPILDSVSSLIMYQGFLSENGAPANGIFDFRFQLYTHPGGVPVGSPIDVNGVSVNNGLFHANVPFQKSSFDGTGRAIGIQVNLGVELVPRQVIGARPYAFRVDRVASEELDDVIALGRGTAPLSAGRLDVHNAAQAQESIQLNGAGHRISTYGSDGLEQIRLWGPTWGEMWLNDNTDNDTTVLLSAGSNQGALMELRDGEGSDRVVLTASANGGTLQLLGETGATNVHMSGGTGTLFARSIGAGTETPLRRLHVSNGNSGGASHTSAELLVEDNTSCYVNLMSPDASERGISFGSPASAIHGGVYYSNVGGMNFRTGGNASRMVIDAMGNVGIGTSAFGLSAQEVLAISVGAVPTTSPADAVQLYAAGASAELFVRDEAGNATVLSPHNFSLAPRSEPMAWSYYSENHTLGEKVNVDMLRVVRLVERLSGEKLVHRSDLAGKPFDEAEEPGTSPDLEGRLRQLETVNAQLRQELAELKDLLRSISQAD